MNVAKKKQTRCVPTGRESHTLFRLFLARCALYRVAARHHLGTAWHCHTQADGGKRCCHLQGVWLPGAFKAAHTASLLQFTILYIVLLQFAILYTVLAGFCLHTALFPLYPDCHFLLSNNLRIFGHVLPGHTLAVCF